MADDLLSDEDLGLTGGDQKVLSDSDLGLDKPEDVTAGMALRGIPVLGAYVPQAEAAIRAAVHPLTGVGEKGDTYAERYAKNLPKREADYAKAESDSPIASTALQVAGGAAALAPIGATALGARALGGVGTLGQRVGAGMASGAGISAADALARGEDPSTAAGIGAGIGAAVPLVGAAAGRIGRAGRGYAGAPTADELAPVVDHNYATLRNSGVEFNPASVNRAINQIAASSDIHPDLTPKTLRLLTETETRTAPPVPGAMSALTGVQPTARPGQTFDDLDTLRKRLGAVARDYSNPTEQLAARDAVRQIDDFIVNVTPADVLRGNASTIAATAREARGNAAAEFRLRTMNAIRERAENAAGAHNSGMNVENSYRRELQKFIRPNNKGISPAMKEGFAPQEIYQIRRATRGTSFPNMLRMVGNMLGGGHGVISGAGLLASYHTQDPRYAMAAGAGMAGRRLSNHMMRSRADNLARMTAARSPLAGVMGTGGPMGPPLNLNPAVQAGAIGMGANLPQQLPPPPFRRGGLVNHYDEGGDAVLAANSGGHGGFDAPWQEAAVQQGLAGDSSALMLANIAHLSGLTGHEHDDDPPPGDTSAPLLARIAATEGKTGADDGTPQDLQMVGGFPYAQDPEGYGFGPYYTASQTEYEDTNRGPPLAPPLWGSGMEGTPPEGAFITDKPGAWMQYYTPNDRSTGGGFFFAGDDPNGGNIAFQEGQFAPSTNNWRLLGNNPNRILRNGREIDLNSTSLRHPFSMTNLFYASGAPWGFPSAIGPAVSPGANYSAVGWPGNDQWYTQGSYRQG